MLILLALAGLTVAVYRPVVDAGFTYEDHESLDNPAPWRGLAVEARAMPFQSRWASALSLRIQSGQSAGAYHAVNLALHLVNGLLLFALTRRFGATVALSAVALWWLHPLQVEAVATVSARTDLLMTTGVLSALLASQLPGWTGVLLASLCAVVAIAAKETGVVVIGLLPLWRWYTGTRWSQAWIVALAVVGAVGVVIGSHAVLTRWGSTAPAPRSALWYAAVQAAAAWRLLSLVVWPVGFTVAHDFDLIGHAVALVAALGAIVAGIVAWQQRQRRPALTFAIAWVALALSPRLAVTQGEFLNEHQMYVPMVGVCLGLAHLGVRSVC